MATIITYWLATIISAFIMCYIGHNYETLEYWIILICVAASYIAGRLFPEDKA